MNRFQNKTSERSKQVSLETLWEEEDEEHDVTSEEVEGKSSRGRRRETIIDGMKDWIKKIMTTMTCCSVWGIRHLGGPWSPTPLGKFNESALEIIEAIKIYCKSSKKYQNIHGQWTSTWSEIIMAHIPCFAISYCLGFNCLFVANKWPWVEFLHLILINICRPTRHQENKKPVSRICAHGMRKN